jgi:23S rRNA pseudouridine955/2504/2580 synthase
METEGNLEFRAGEDDSGKRLDSVLRKALPGAGLSAIYSLIRRGGVRVDGAKASIGMKIHPGNRIAVRDRSGILSRSLTPTEREPLPEMPLSVPELIIFENDHVLALDKPRGRTAHGPGGLDSYVRAYLLDRIPASISFKPGPCHRLDRGTTGVLLFAKSLLGAHAAHEAFSSSAVIKIYIAVLDGSMTEACHWIDSLKRLENENRSVRSDPSGKKAETFVLPLASNGSKSLAIMRISTGRNHQIRAQSASRGHPLSGDAKYGGSPLRGGFILHCAEIGFQGREDDPLPPRLSSPLPQDSRSSINVFFGNGSAERAMSEAARLVSIEWG